MHNKSILELRKMLDTKTISSVELTTHFLNRIKKYDPDLNSFITITESHALEAAKKADERIQSGKVEALTGIPLAQKDIFCTHGIKTSCGSKMLDNFIAPYDATVISRFHHAGAIMLGKTNMDEFAMGSSNENSFYGAVKNPWNLAAVPGGSSGGSSAAVAARLAPGATGTDTGGSIRQPAAHTGITGIKPTYGRVSRFGMIAFASSLDQGGPMAKSAEDCAVLLQAMSGFDEKDSTSANEPVPDYVKTLNDSLAGLKIGLPKAFFAEGLDPAIAKSIDEAIRCYEKMGATIKDVELPHLHYALPAYYVLAPAECSSNLARYDGVRFGHRCENPQNLHDLYQRSRSEGFGEEVQRRILIGTYALSAGYYDAYYIKSQKIRRLISEDYQKAFSEVDVIAGPVTPAPAFHIGEKKNDPLSMYLSDIYTIPVNLAGLPGMSLPVGFVNGLPIGMQLVGNYFSEARLLNIAHQFQLQTDWHLQIPKNY